MSVHLPPRHRGPAGAEVKVSDDDPMLLWLSLVTALTVQGGAPQGLCPMTGSVCFLDRRESLSTARLLVLNASPAGPARPTTSSPRLDPARAERIVSRGPGCPPGKLPLLLHLQLQVDRRGSLLGLLDRVSVLAGVV